MAHHLEVALILVVAIVNSADAVRREPTDVDDFLASLDLAVDPATVVQNANLDHSRSGHATTEEEAIMTLETVRDREDQMHLSEAHRMKCDEVLRGSGRLGEHRGPTMESSYMTTAEDQTIYSDPNDDTTSGGSPMNAHPAHRSDCHMVKSHSVRKIAMLGELDMPPFFEKLGEFDITGVVHDKLSGDDEFVKVIMKDPKSVRLTTRHPRKTGYGLDTILANGMPNEKAPHPLKEWILTSKTWDSEVKPKLEAIAKEIEVAKEKGPSSGMHPASLDCSNAFSSTTDVNFTVELGCLLKAIEGQEKYVPFNHKLEKASLEFVVCKHRGLFSSSFTCVSKGTLYIHDGKLVADSADEALVDWLVASNSPNALSLSSYLPNPGLKMKTASGFNMEIEGGIKWDVSISKQGHCTPAMQPLLYVGIGADEDPDDPDDDVDLDMGAVLYKWEPSPQGSNMVPLGSLYYGSTGQKPGQLDASFRPRKCEITGGRGRHQPTSHRTNSCGDGSGALVEYSGDNLDGSGEGDDEWMLFDLEKLQEKGVTHIALTVHIYSKATFSQLEGAFFRAVVSARGEKQWATAQTVQYADLDEMKSAGRERAAIVATFFVDDLKHILLPNDAKKAQQNHDLANDETLIALKSRLSQLHSKGSSMSAAERAEFFETKTKFTVLAKTKFEIVSSKHPVPCGGQCNLKSSFRGIEQYFRQKVLPAGGTSTDFFTALDSSKVANETEKVTDANQVAMNDLDSQDMVSDLDNFLASLDEAIPPNPQLGVDQSNNAIDRAAQSISQEEFNEALLIEFPGGPPGADVLCLKS